MTDEQMKAVFGIRYQKEWIDKLLKEIEEVDDQIKELRAKKQGHLSVIKFAQELIQKEIDALKI